MSNRSEADGYGRDWDGQPAYPHPGEVGYDDRAGYDQAGHDDRAGYDQAGHDDRAGYDQAGYDDGAGYDQAGYHQGGDDPEWNGEPLQQQYQLPEDAGSVLGEVAQDAEHAVENALGNIGF